MSDVIFVVNIQDFAYAKPMVKVEFAGRSAKQAYEHFNKAVSCDDGKLRITLDVVEGNFSKRLETYTPSGWML